MTPSPLFAKGQVAIIHQSPIPPIFGEDWGIFRFFLALAIEARAVRNRLPAKPYNVKKTPEEMFDIVKILGLSHKTTVATRNYELLRNDICLHDD